MVHVIAVRDEEEEAPDEEEEEVVSDEESRTPQRPKLRPPSMRRPQRCEGAPLAADAQRVNTSTSQSTALSTPSVVARTIRKALDEAKASASRQFR